MQLTILGSGSSGNCAVVSTDSTTLLVDVGLSARQTVEGLDLLGLKLDDLDGILLTHEHQDHIGGLEGLSRGRVLPLFCTTLTQEYLLRNLHFSSPPAWHLMQTGSIIDYRDFQIENFPVMHDAVDPVGYVLTSANARLGFTTDLGYVTQAIKESLRGVHALFVEANYEPQLLEEDTKRPWATKQRIASCRGHLSNHQTAELISEIAHPRLKTVVLGHLSEDCNSPDRAVFQIRHALDAAGATQTRVVCAECSKPTPKIEVS
jgi:phosphoribosyl 1,2-cyclic phosphodiesterase